MRSWDALITLGNGHLSVLTLTWSDATLPDPFSEVEIRRRFGNLYQRLVYWQLCSWTVAVLHTGPEVRGDLHIVLDLQP